MKQDTLNSHNYIYNFFYNDYVVELAGSLIFAVVGLLVIYFLRPRVKISPKIACRKNDQGQLIYNIKVINRSYLFQLVDLHFELSMLKPISSPKGMNLAIKKIDLAAEHLWYLSRRKVLSDSNSFATYAVILKVNDTDLEALWKKDDGAFLDVKVIAKNNFSGITGIIKERYNHVTTIKKGQFCHGNSMDIEVDN